MKNPPGSPQAGHPLCSRLLGTQIRLQPRLQARLPNPEDRWAVIAAARRLGDDLAEVHEDQVNRPLRRALAAREGSRP